MNDIKFSKDEIAGLVIKLKGYFDSELDYDIGGFEAEFLIDFISKEVGPYFYNRGLPDAHALFTDKADELGYSIQELEKPTL